MKAYEKRDSSNSHISRTYATFNVHTSSIKLFFYFSLLNEAIDLLYITDFILKFYIFRLFFIGVICF
jgi:hypothetical protein